MYEFLYMVAVNKIRGTAVGFTLRPAAIQAAESIVPARAGDGPRLLFWERGMTAGGWRQPPAVSARAAAAHERVLSEHPSHLRIFHRSIPGA